MKLYARSSRNRWFLFTGILLTTSGLVLLLSSTSIYEFAIRTAISLDPSSKAFRGWSKTDLLTMDFYFFNWTNPEQINIPGVKPKFEEVGPFRFKFDIERINVTWHENGSMSYQTVKRYYHYEKESPMNLSEMITTINIVSLVSS